MSSLNLGCGYVAGESVAFFDAPILKAKKLSDAADWPKNSIFSLTFECERIELSELKLLNTVLQKQQFASLILVTTAQTPVNFLTQIKIENRHFEIFELNPSKEQRTQALLRAFEKSQTLKQQAELNNLIHSQTQKLSQSQAALEQKITLKQSQLVATKNRVHFAQTRFETLQQCLFIIQNSKSTLEFSAEVAPTIARGLQADWVKLCWTPQESAQVSMNKANYVGWSKTSIVFGTTTVGELIAVRQNAAFTAPEKSFFEEICELISLYWDRLQKLQRVLDLKENWQITFDAIDNPVALISKNYQVIQANRSFFKADSGLKCYEILFNRTKPCEQCNLGQSFRIRIDDHSQTHFWDVKSQQVFTREGFFLNHYHELTERLNLENDLLQKAKAAEIGTIASSLAHELNNPLGALLNFVQLLKMDTPIGTSLFEDLSEMENAAKRSTELVQNILSFARDLGHQTASPLLYIDLVSQTVKFIELLYRFRRVKIEFKRNEDFQYLSPQSHLLKQVLRYLLSSLVNLQHETKGELNVEIKLSVKKKNISLQLQACFSEPLERASLRISLAQALVKQIQGTVQLHKSSNKGMTVECLLPK